MSHPDSNKFNNYPELKKLMDKLLSKSYRTPEEERLLQELLSIKLQPSNTFSLALSSMVCPTCGRAIK